MFKSLFLLLLIVGNSQGDLFGDALGWVGDTMGIPEVKKAGEVIGQVGDVVMKGVQICGQFVPKCKVVAAAGTASDTLGNIIFGGKSGQIMGSQFPYQNENGQTQYTNLNGAITMVVSNITNKVQESNEAVKQYFGQQITVINQGINQTQDLINKNIEQTSTILTNLNTMNTKMNKIQDGLQSISGQVDNMQDYLITMSNNITQGMQGILDQISQQSASLTEQLKKLFAEVKQSDCFSTIWVHKETISNSMAKLQAYYASANQIDIDNNKASFTAICQDCEKALIMMISAMGAGSDSPCNFLDIFYQGNPEKDYIIGYRQDLLDKSANMLNYIYQGITATAAYYTLDKNTTNAGDYIGDQYKTKVQTIIDNIYNKADQCNTDMWENIKENQKRILVNRVYSSNQAFGDDVYFYLNKAYPWYDWNVITYDTPATSQLQDSLVWFMINQVVVSTKDNKKTAIITGFQKDQNSSLEFYTATPLESCNLLKQANLLWQIDGVSGVFLVDTPSLYGTYLIGNTFNGSLDETQLLWRSSLRQGHSKFITLPESDSSQSICNQQNVKKLNMAEIGAVATQISTLDHLCNPTADKAIDGNPDGNFDGCSITHTIEEQDPWWCVDLQQSYDIFIVTVYNRYDCCSSRLSNYSVYIGDKHSFGDNPTCGDGLNGGQSLICNMHGQHICIQIKGIQALSLAEVEVYVYQ